MRVAVIGCGKIADAHGWAIRSIPGCEIVAACDRERLMAEQFQVRFGAGSCFTDAAEMLSAARPDVVHITTPPQSHYPLGMLSLERGCHVYIEKPFTCTAEEAEELLSQARLRNLMVTVGHDDQFRHSARRMRMLIREGYLGDPPYHMESYYGYEIGSAGYAKALLGDKKHWVRSLPGGLLHNVISHGIAHLSEHFETDAPALTAHAFVSGALKRLGETEIVDELRVLLSETTGHTGYFTFSSQIRPSLHQFRIFGSRNALLIDQDSEVLVRIAGRRRKSYLEQFVTPMVYAREYVGSAWFNVRAFMRRDFHSKAGMMYLIRSFYEAIAASGPPPVPYAEILRTARIMDAIFAQLPQPGPGQEKAA